MAEKITKAQQLLDYIATGNYTVEEVHAHTGIPRANCRTYLWQFTKRGLSTRSGTRGQYRWTASGKAPIAPSAEQEAHTPGTFPATKETGELGTA